MLAKLFVSGPLKEYAPSSKKFVEFNIAFARNIVSNGLMDLNNPIALKK